MPVRGHENSGQFRIAPQLIASGYDLAGKRPTDRGAVDRQILGGRQELGPVQAAVTGLQQGHATDVHRESELTVRRGQRQEDDGFDSLLLGVVNQASTAPAKRGGRRQRRRHGAIGGHGRIGGRTAAGQNVPGDQNRPGLVGGDRAGKAADGSAAEIGRWCRLVAAAGRQADQAECRKKQLRLPGEGHSSWGQFGDG